ncbi:hypothetical protein ACS0TY_015924 [Phlomoides rotata]
MKFCQSFMNELYRYLGPDKDLPSEEMGVGTREMGYLYGQYRRLTGHSQAYAIYWEQEVLREIKEHWVAMLEATSKLGSEGNYMYCVYDSDIATGYGVVHFYYSWPHQSLIVRGTTGTVFMILILQPDMGISIILGEPSNYNGCKVTFLIVEACLLAGSVRNAYHTKCTTQFFNQPPSCKTVRKGVFAAGAAFILFTGISSEFYYTSYFKARGSFAPYRGEAGVGMASYK